MSVQEIRAKQIIYGTENLQYGLLYLPSEPPAPLIILIHGGFWRSTHDLGLMTPIATTLADYGYAVWNIEYRTVNAGGGWPNTFEDVAAAIDAVDRISEKYPVERPYTVMGHSAGAHLALWAAARSKLDHRQPGSRPTVVPDLVVSLSGICDLEAAAKEGLGDCAAEALLGGTVAEVPERYLFASPYRHIPLATNQVLVHGDSDELVPVDHSRRFVTAARRHGAVDYLELPGVDHVSLIRTLSPAWQETWAWLQADDRVAVSARSSRATHSDTRPNDKPDRKT